MCIPDRNHDLMMAAWVMRLHRKAAGLDPTLALAEDRREKDTQLDARRLRDLLTAAGIEAIEVHGDNRVLEELAVAYAGERCCALVRLCGLEDDKQPGWHLVLGYAGEDLATTDYQCPATQARFQGPFRSYMMGQCVIAIKPIAHIRESWSDILEAIDHL